MKPAWVKCSCGDYFCKKHELHAHDCHCPPLEDWVALGLDPYRDMHPGDKVFARERARRGTLESDSAN